MESEYKNPSGVFHDYNPRILAISDRVSIDLKALTGFAICPVYVTSLKVFEPCKQHLNKREQFVVGALC